MDQEPDRVPVIAVGSVDLQTEFSPGAPGGRIAADGVERLAQGYVQDEFDIVAIGRALLADPTWVARLRSGDLSGFTGYDGAVALAGLHQSAKQQLREHRLRRKR